MLAKKRKFGLSSLFLDLELSKLLLGCVYRFGLVYVISLFSGIEMNVKLKNPCCQTRLLGNELGN